MKITTKMGDKGETGLRDGRRVRKDAKEIRVLGAIDELQAHLGLCKFGEGVGRDEVAILERLQDDLYRIMGGVGVDVEWLDDAMKRYDVGDLGEFIRPGSTEAAARFNVARTVCRRAEMEMVSGGVEGENLKYINRLSDLLFVMGFGLEK